MGGNRARPHLLAGDREPALARPPGGGGEFFNVLCFPMITMCMIDTRKKIQTKLKKSYTLPCVVFGAGAWARAPPRPAQERGPRGLAPAPRGAPGQRRAPGAASQAGGPRRRGRGPPGGGGGAPCFGWRMAGERLCAPGPGERKASRRRAAPPPRCSRRFASRRGEPARAGEGRGLRAPDQRKTRPLAQGPWAYGPMTQGPMAQGPAAAALFALARAPGRALGPRAETERLSERSSACLWALDSWPSPPARGV